MTHWILIHSWVSFLLTFTTSLYTSRIIIWTLHISFIIEGENAVTISKKIGWTLNFSNFLIVKDFYNNSNPFRSWHLRNGSSKNPLSCKIYHIRFACTQVYVTIMHKTIFSWEAMISFNLSRKRQIWNRIMFQFFSFRSRSSDMTPPPEVRRIPTVISSPHRISVSSSGILMISIYSKFDINRRSSVDHPGVVTKTFAKRAIFSKSESTRKLLCRTFRFQDNISMP